MRCRIRFAVLPPVLIGLFAGVLASCGSSPQGPDYDPQIDPDSFVTGISNAYLPFPVGATWIYTGNSGESTLVTVTDSVRVVMGVSCTVVHDSVFVNGLIQEATSDWYAQHVDGTVWYFGEFTQEFDETGQVISTEGSWEAGVDGALPGIVMMGEPVVGTEYRQEYYEDEAEDWAKVISLSDSVTVTYGTFPNCLVTEEWTPLEPGFTEHKYYAEGIGMVYAVTIDGGSEAEELVSYTPPPGR